MNDFEGHADKVLTDLRAKVNAADGKLIHLQEKLDCISSEAMSENDQGVSSTSDFDEEDVSKYLEDFTDNTVDESFSSICSSSSKASIKKADTLGKKFFISSPIEHENLEQWEIQPRMTSLKKDIVSSTISCQKNKKKEKVPGFPDNFSKQIHMVPGSENNNYPFKLGRDEAMQDSLHTEDEANNRNNEFLIPVLSMRKSNASEQPVSARSEGDITKKVYTPAENMRIRLENLDAEKTKNSKLMDKVNTLEKDLSEMKLKLELRSHEETTGKLLGLIDEIQHAQKSRESAMMDRLRIAAKDRDEAVLRTKALHVKNLHLQKMQNIGPHGNRDKTLLELIDRIATADSGRIIEKYGAELVERLNNMKNARSRITAEEMSIVIKERDEALAKCLSLEQDLQNCIEELNLLKKTKDTSVNTTLKERVLATQEENSQTQEKLQEAQEEIEKLRHYCSLQKSLTLAQDEELAEKYNEYMNEVREEAIRRVQHAKQVEADNRQLHDRLLVVTQEKCKEEDRNKKLEVEAHQLREKCSKLERLVKVLRRKLVGYSQSQAKVSSPTQVKGS